jgi:hypothetical protein
VVHALTHSVGVLNCKLYTLSVTMVSTPHGYASGCLGRYGASVKAGRAAAEMVRAGRL